MASALGFALTSSSHHSSDPEPVAVNNRQLSDALATAPKDYSAARLAEAAKLPPPGPASASVAPTPLSATPQPADRDPALQQRHQRQESARASKLFASDTSRVAPAAEGVGGTSTPQPNAGSAPAAPSSADAQDRKAAFVTGGSGTTQTVNSGRLMAPAGRYTLQAGATIAAALITGLSSDLPGEVVAQVTEDVFDSATGQALLVPQGSRLIGSYDAHVSFGQSRALVAWTRLILPDGRSLDLDRLVGTDGSGQSGFADRMDHHTGKLLEAGLLSTLLGLGSNLTTSGGGANNDIAFAIRDSAGQSIERTGDKLVGHQLDVQPTITIRPGARVRVLVSRDLILAPSAQPGK
ncbi:TrbI/VirB10 family protein [Sphingomonas sp. PAMC 26617]|uniref:TrbI/VirB10 family protein n=1 Tax=Sphingomonas sp. PAMC 26617 TaxID=1112216 RepID=UPI0002893836|nr:TrbI/VirB10 family protein [Sphingomonas sp. PAMC 26617]